MFVEKKYKYIPLVFISIILYSFLGYFTYNDLFWVFTKRPYSSLGTYGSGSLFHFVSNYKNTFGTIISFSFIIGVGLIVFSMLKKRLVNILKEKIWLLLIVFPTISVVGIHSVLWWKGLQGSAGLLRITATVVPLSVLVSLYVVNFFEIEINKRVTGAKKYL